MFSNKFCGKNFTSARNRIVDHYRYFMRAYEIELIQPEYPVLTIKVFF